MGGFIDVHSQAQVGSWTCTARHGWIHGRAQPGTGGFMDVHSQARVGSWTCTSRHRWVQGRAQPGTDGFMDIHSQAQFIDAIFFPIACFLCFPDVIRLDPYNASYYYAFVASWGGAPDLSPSELLPKENMYSTTFT